MERGRLLLFFFGFFPLFSFDNLWQRVLQSKSKLCVWTLLLTPAVTVFRPEPSSCPACSTPSPRPPAETEPTSGGSEACGAPRGTCGRAGRICRRSRCRPSSPPTRESCCGKVRTKRWCVIEAPRPATAHTCSSATKEKPNLS